jgi:tyrosyl-tRNA synthetase
MEDIAALEAQHQATPERRAAHKKLALELTRLVHGESATADAVRASEILFGGSLEGITEAQFDEVIAEVPNFTTTPEQILGQPSSSLLVTTGLSASGSQARRDIEAGGFYINNVRITDSKWQVKQDDFLFGQYILVRKGKRNYALVRAAK